MKNSRRIGVLSALVALALGSFGVPSSVLAGGSGAMSDGDLINGQGRITVTKQENGDVDIGFTEMTISGSGAVKATTDTDGNYTISVSTGRIDSRSDNVLATTLGVYNYLQATNLKLAGASSAGSSALAFGYKASAAGESAVAIGSSASASQWGNVAIGDSSKATGEGTVAVGQSAKALGTSATAVGNYAQAKAGYATAVGYATAFEINSVAIGNLTKAKSANSIAMGNTATTEGEHAIALGSSATAGGAKSFASGYFAQATAEGANVLGGYGTASETNALALGQWANSSAVDAVAIGAESTATTAVTTAEDGTKTATVSFGHKKGDFSGWYYIKEEDGTIKYNSVQSTGYELYNYETDKFSRLTNVADGVDNHDAATYGQLVSANAIKDTSGAITGYTPYSADSNGIVTVLTNKGETAFQIKVGSSGGSTGSYTGDNRTIGVSATNVISVKYDTADLTVNDNGLAVKKDGKVEAGNTGLVTGGTVYDALQAMDNQAARLTDDINKVGAGAAALAALRPEGFNPNDKWSFAVGYGHYKNANAGALGAFFKPNADTTVSLSSTIGNGDPMMNAGLSFKLGQRGKNAGAYRNAVELVRRVDALEATDARHEALIAAQQKEIAAQAQEIRELREQVAALMKHAGLTASVQKAVTR